MVEPLPESVHDLGGEGLNTGERHDPVKPHQAAVMLLKLQERDQAIPGAIGNPIGQVIKDHPHLLLNLGQDLKAIPQVKLDLSIIKLNHDAQSSAASLSLIVGSR
jgi:hypothetical protein